MLAAIYLPVEAQDAKARDLGQVYRRRARCRYRDSCTWGMWTAPAEAPLLWTSKLERALPLIAVTVIVEAAT